MATETKNKPKTSEKEESFEFDLTEKDLEKAITDDTDRTLIKRILQYLDDAKAENIILIDAQQRSSLADYLLICEGRSQLHCRGIAEDVQYKMKHQGELSLGIEGEKEGNWVLLDYGNIILHVFHPAIRKYYKLEELYERRPNEDNFAELESL
ncbi:MAG: ribosome silencing factor [SAR324 cluster bacterium]|nr:ribosome silencing factor [SAR324 cluster bacterium]MBL7035770.1 ribosome silencing factor [SAR324 cluster bacterium]